MKRLNGFLSIIIAFATMLSVTASTEMLCSSTVPNHSVAQTNAAETFLTTTDEYKNEFNKLHFYMDSDQYETIDSMSELQQAVPSWKYA